MVSVGLGHNTCSLEAIGAFSDFLPLQNPYRSILYWDSRTKLIEIIWKSDTALLFGKTHVINMKSLSVVICLASAVFQQSNVFCVSDTLRANVVSLLL